MKIPSPAGVVLKCMKRGFARPTRRHALRLTRALRLCCIAALAAELNSAVGWIFKSVSLGEEVQGSDCIVIGTLRDVRASVIQLDGVHGIERSGTIHIDRVLWGSVRKGERLRLVWHYDVIARGPVDWRHCENLQRVWLLNSTGGGTVRAGPFQARDLSDQNAVEKAIRDFPICARARQWWNTTSTQALVTLEFRNATTHPVSLRMPVCQGRKLLLPEGTSISLESDRPVVPRPGALETSATAPQSVLPGKSAMVRVYVHDYFDLAAGRYALSWSVAGFPPGRAAFCVSPPAGRQSMSTPTAGERFEAWTRSHWETLR